MGSGAVGGARDPWVGPGLLGGAKAPWVGPGPRGWGQVLERSQGSLGLLSPDRGKCGLRVTKGMKKGAFVSPSQGSRPCQLAFTGSL